MVIVWPGISVYAFEYPNRHFVRKEQNDFGWDWSPAFVPTGPWRDGRIVQLRNKKEAYPLNTAVDVYRKGQANNFAPDQSEHWVVNASVDFLGVLPQGSHLRATITDADDESSVLYDGELENVSQSNMTITGSITVDADKPKLWWPRDMGHQKLYKIRVFVPSKCGTTAILTTEKRIGFRTILLDVGNVTTAHIARGYQPGNNWHFEVNGREFYAKGANMVPPDAFWPRVSKDSMKNLFESTEAQNFNMMRVWSSGAYLPDFIYDIADERGVLLWSEFQFGDSLYPDDPAFLQNIVGEVSYNVRRINHHPSLACWVGGNELENLMLPLTAQAAPERLNYFVGQYEDLFINTIFRTLAANTRSISYTPSSGNNGFTNIDFSLPVPMVQRYNNKTTGEMYGDTEFYNYDTSISFNLSKYPVGRFSTEFGFPSMPSLETWQQALEPEDLHFNSSTITLRNHHYPPNGLSTDNYANGTKGLVEMTLGVERYYPAPNKKDPIGNFGSWCHATQLFQADFYKNQIQFYRHRSGFPERQLGSLFWQLNDIWQAPSWAAIEYDGRWKVVAYAVRNAYKHVIVSPLWDYEHGKLELWVTSDLWEQVSGTVSLSWVDLSGKPIANNAGMPTSLDFQVEAINSTLIATANISDIKLPDKEDAILMLTLTANGQLPNSEDKIEFSHENHFIPVWPKDLKLVDPGLKLTYNKGTGKFDVEATKGVALYTWLHHDDTVSGFFDDNAFMLLPGQKKEVDFKVQYSTDIDWMNSVTIQSLWDLTTE